MNNTYEILIQNGKTKNIEHNPNIWNAYEIERKFWWIWMKWVPRSDHDGDRIWITTEGSRRWLEMEGSRRWPEMEGSRVTMERSRFCWLNRKRRVARINRFFLFFSFQGLQGLYTELCFYLFLRNYPLFS